MPKRRRKLSKDFEKQIAAGSKQIELILAKINDIDDDDIRLEYATSFAPVKVVLDKINQYYKENGFTSESEPMILHYKSLLDKFISEYEI